jgi:hypothetical protein
VEDALAAGNPDTRSRACPNCQASAVAVLVGGELRAAPDLRLRRRRWGVFAERLAIDSRESSLPPACPGPCQLKQHRCPPGHADSAGSGRRAGAAGRMAPGAHRLSERGSSLSLSLSLSRTLCLSLGLAQLGPTALLLARTRVCARRRFVGALAARTGGVRHQCRRRRRRRRSFTESRATEPRVGGGPTRAHRPSERRIFTCAPRRHSSRLRRLRVGPYAPLPTFTSTSTSTDTRAHSLHTARNTHTHTHTHTHIYIYQSFDLSFSFSLSLPPSQSRKVSLAPARPSRPYPHEHDGRHRHRHRAHGGIRRA